MQIIYKVTKILSTFYPYNDLAPGDNLGSLLNGQTLSNSMLLNWWCIITVKENAENI